MNNLLTRELPLYCTIRLWDTYLAESDGFAVFQLYVCAAFLLHWRDQLLQERDFQVGYHLLSSVFQFISAHRFLPTLAASQTFGMPWSCTPARGSFEYFKRFEAFLPV